MNKLHIAIATHDLAASIADYTARLGAPPCVVLPGAYALWRTAIVNLSVRADLAPAAGTSSGVASAGGAVRHLGWEDSSAPAFTQDTDVNGIVWEHFSAAQQADEINALWPEAGYRPAPLE